MDSSLCWILQHKSFMVPGTWWPIFSHYGYRLKKLVAWVANYFLLLVLKSNMGCRLWGRGDGVILLLREKSVHSLYAATSNIKFINQVIGLNKWGKARKYGIKYYSKKHGIANPSHWGKELSVSVEWAMARNQHCIFFGQQAWEYSSHRIKYKMESPFCIPMLVVLFYWFY